MRDAAAPAHLRPGRRLAAVLGVTVLAGGILSGCAPASEGSREARLPTPSDTGTPACFYWRQVSDFKVLDRSNLIVYAPSRSTAYHVRISPPSLELRSTATLAFNGDSRICGYAGERLYVGGLTRREQHAIIGVSRLDADGLAMLLALAEGPGPAATEPEQPEGAVISRDLDRGDAE